MLAHGRYLEDKKIPVEYIICLLIRKTARMETLPWLYSYILRHRMYYNPSNPELYKMPEFVEEKDIDKTIYDSLIAAVKRW